jgi:hypothetical protein
MSKGAIPEATRISRERVDLAVLSDLIVHEVSPSPGNDQKMTTEV